MSSKPVGVFDSGLGGLTVLQELRLAMPNENFVYFGDTGRVPYGGKDNETILRYAREDAAFLLENGVKYIVAACGTVSSVCGSVLGEELPVPFTGVVEHGARAASLATKSGRIGILGTEGTIRSGAYEKVIHSFLPDAELISRACPMFVPLVENGYTDIDSPVAKLIAEEYLADLIAFEVDTVILGCTHYPFLRPLLQRIMGADTVLIDVGRETAAHVQQELMEKGICNDRKAEGNIALFASDGTDRMAKFATEHLGAGPLSVKKISF